MAETITNDLLLEHLKSIQSRMTYRDDQLTRIENELRAIKAHISGLAQSDLNRDTDYASLALRIERIERRLDISD